MGKKSKEKTKQRKGRRCRMEQNETKEARQHGAGTELEIRKQNFYSGRTFIADFKNILHVK